MAQTGMIIQKINRRGEVTKELGHGELKATTTIGDIIQQGDVYSFSTRTCRVIVSEDELVTMAKHVVEMRDLRARLKEQDHEPKTRTRKRRST